jgi:hypothetical protein
VRCAEHPNYASMTCGVLRSERPCRRLFAAVP